MAIGGNTVYCSIQKARNIRSFNPPIVIAYYGTKQCIGLNSQLSYTRKQEYYRICFNRRPGRRLLETWIYMLKKPALIIRRGAYWLEVTGLIRTRMYQTIPHLPNPKKIKYRDVFLSIVSLGTEFFSATSQTRRLIIGDPAFIEDWGLAYYVKHRRFFFQRASRPGAYFPFFQKQHFLL